MLRRAGTWAASVLLHAAALAADTDPYPVTVWSSVLFDTEGKASSYEVMDETKLPAQFVQNVKARLARARMQPPQDGGAPATFRTGVRMEFVVTPGASGGSATLKGLAMEPLPLTRYYASYPRDVARTSGWEGQVSATCTVGTDGRCTQIDVQALPGMPDSVRRYARASLEQWEFEPQQLNGKPVVGEYVMHLRLETLDNVPENFREPKFERLIRSRSR